MKFYINVFIDYKYKNEFKYIKMMVILEWTILEISMNADLLII